VYTTPGIRALGGVPAWMGTDEWPVFRSALADQVTLDTPAVFDPQAYVSGGVLVGRIARMPLQLRSAIYSLTVTLSQVVISATVEPAEGGYRLKDGTLAGSWGLPDIFQGLSEFRLFGQPICTDNDEYTSIKPAFCDRVDMRVEGGAPEAPCDAVSFGLRFLAEPALLYVDPFDDEMVTPACEPTLDPMFDTCDE